MPSLFARAILFLSGYMPLFVIFTIQYYPKYQHWALIPAGIGLVALIGLLVFIHRVKMSEPRSIKVQSVQRKDAEVIAYIFAYVFPFLGLNVDDPMSMIGLGVFFFVLMVLNISSNMVHINPALSLLGFHVYEVCTAEQESQTLITRKPRLVRSTEMSAVLMGDDIWMEK